MFAGISINDEKKGKNYIYKNYTQYELGKHDWQQEWKSIKQNDYINKELKDNKVDLSNKKYLKFNYSHIENSCNQKNRFLSSSRRDYTQKPIEKNENKTNKDFQNASKILGDYTKKIDSSYNDHHCDPKKQNSKFNYNKINFNYDQYRILPITSDQVYKPKDKNWGFDYWNKDIAKHSNSNDKLQVLNADFRKVYDPITNRYFK